MYPREHIIKRVLRDWDLPSYHMLRWCPYRSKYWERYHRNRRTERLWRSATWSLVSLRVLRRGTYTGEQKRTEPITRWWLSSWLDSILFFLQQIAKVSMKIKKVLYKKWIMPLLLCKIQTKVEKRKSREIISAKSAKRLHAYKIRTETESMWQSHNHQHIKQLRGKFAHQTSTHWCGSFVFSIQV